MKFFSVEPMQSHECVHSDRHYYTRLLFQNIVQFSNNDRTHTHTHMNVNPYHNNVMTPRTLVVVVVVPD